MKRLYIAILALLLPLSLFAQAEESALILYLDDPFEVQIFDANGFEVENPDIGTMINPGDQIETGNTSVELQLQENGSIMRIAEQTSFQMETIQGRGDASETAMSVGRGRMRMVAARVSGRDSRYSVRTPGAVAGVRGTDFGVEVVPSDVGEALEELFVFDGEVLFSALETGQEIFVAAGQRANLFAESFLPVTMSVEEQAQRQESLGFQAADPTVVPGNEPEPEEVAEETTTDTVDAVVLEEEPEETEPAEPGAGDALFAAFAEITGMQVGSVTINNETYAQAVFQPQVTLGKFKAGFYLPITYTENLFDPSDWYRPRGNDEWSFGMEYWREKEYVDGLVDAATDIVLKFKYLEYGDRDVDNFYFKVGNLNSFTLGQGLLMQNYANDIDFPVVRRIGFQMGADFNSWGFEGMVNDFLDPYVMGGRLFFRPAAEVLPVAIGFTGITDLTPAAEVAATDTSETDTVDPIFLNFGTDLSIPIVRRQIFSLLTYAEAGFMLPYLRNDGTDLSSGPQLDAIYTLTDSEVTLSNYGWIAGIRGNALMVNYRLEFRSFEGTFRPSFYDSSYDRMRSTYAVDAVTYLQNPDAEAYTSTTLGVFGEADANLFNLIGMTAGYFWPWDKTADGSFVASDDDELIVQFSALDGLIPLGITAGLEYRRTHFAATVAKRNDYSDSSLLVDVNTTLDGYLTYPLTEQIMVVARVSTAMKRDDAGEIEYGSDGNPKVAPVVTIQTEIGL